MKQIFVIILLICTSISVPVQGQSPLSSPDKLMGNRFLTFNTIIRVNQIEVSRDRNEGLDERSMHTRKELLLFAKPFRQNFRKPELLGLSVGSHCMICRIIIKRSGNW